MKSCALVFVIDGIEDGLILLKIRYRQSVIGKQMRLFNDGELHKDPFEIFRENMVDAPVFKVIDIDEDEDIDIN